MPRSKYRQPRPQSSQPSTSPIARRAAKTEQFIGGARQTDPQDSSDMPEGPDGENARVVTVDGEGVVRQFLNFHPEPEYLVELDEPTETIGEGRLTFVDPRSGQEVTREVTTTSETKYRRYRTEEVRFI